MKLRALFVLIALLLPAVAAAQTSGEIDNCCFVDRQCQSDAQWVAGYWAYQNNQCSASSQQSSTQSSPQPANIDNCCFAGWQCHSDQQWTDGYFAFQNGQCAAPQQQSSAPSSPQPANIDNCCFAGWQCSADGDWSAGYFSYQTNQCVQPNLRYEGPPSFVAQYRAAFELLKTKAPQWYWYAASGLDVIRQNLSRSSTAALLIERGVVSHYGDHNYPGIDWFAIQLVHEACHVHMWEAGVWYNEGWRNELPCHELDLQAIRRVDSNSRHIAWIETIIDNYRNHQTWWGAGDWPG